MGIQQAQAMPRKARNIVATVERNVVELRAGDDTLILHCASRQHAEILGQALLEGVAHFETDLRAVDTLRTAMTELLGKIAVMNGCNPHDFDVACSDEAWPEFHAAHAALKATETLSAEPRFMVVDESQSAPDDERATFHSLSDQLKANVDDPDYCAWLRKAEPGERYSNGGGAAPLIATWRV